MVAPGGDGGSIQGRKSQQRIAACEMGRTIELLRGVASHFAVAASQLAEEAGVAPGDAVRLRAAEALFRAQAADSGLRSRAPSRGPFVRLGNGETPPLTVLFACMDDRRLRSHSLRSIDLELVLLIREMLGGLKWYLPDEEESPDRVPLQVTEVSRVGHWLALRRE